MSTQPPERHPHDYDEVTRLRLQLAHTEMQRDALKAAAMNEALKVVRVSIIQATIDLDEENARLKAEVERLTNLKPGADYLKAKVDRLKVAGEDLAHAVRTKRSIDFALEEWDRLIAAGQ